MQKNTGTHIFQTENHYDHFNNGGDALIIYLHGYNQNKYVMQKKMEGMLKLKAQHIFLDAPYPIYDSSRSKPVEKWGRAWYIYDGEQKQFLRSLEECSHNLKVLVNNLRDEFGTDKVCMVGYSMGAYQAGYYALSRPETLSHCICINGRIKSEAFSAKELKKASGLHILALHGKEDQSVYPDPQKKEIEKLSALGYDAEFIMPECGHMLEPVFTNLSKEWLIKQSFKL